MVSMGATATEASQPIQAMAKLTRGPWLICKNRIVPPATGKLVANSAKVSAISIIKQPPITQDKTAEGPAICATKKGPSNQPEPTIPPTAANKSEKVPIDLFNCIFWSLQQNFQTNTGFRRDCPKAAKEAKWTCALLS